VNEHLSQKVQPRLCMLEVGLCWKWTPARTFSVQDWSAYDRTIFAELLRPCIASSTQHQWTFDTTPPCTYRFFVESAIMTYAYKPGIRWLRSMPLSEATLSCCQATLCCQATPRRRAVKPARVWQLKPGFHLYLTPLPYPYCRKNYVSPKVIP